MLRASGASLGRDLLRRLLIGALVVTSLSLAARFLDYAWRLLRYPMQWDIREALSLHHALILLSGEPLYGVRYEPPLVMPIFGPGYPGLAAPLVAWFGVSMLGPRLLSGLAALGLVLSVFLATRRLTGRASWGAIAVGAVLMEFFWFRWLLLCRPDGLGSFLTLMALLVHQHRPRTASTGVASAALGALAFFTKPYLFLAPLATLTSSWLLERDRRRARTHTVTLVLLLAGGLGLACGLTGGLYFLHVFQIQLAWAGVDVRQAAGLTLKMFVVYSPLWAALLLGLRRGLPVDRYGALLAHVALGTPVMALFLLNDGAGGYYWLVTVPALVVVGCAELAREADDPRSLAAPALLAALLLIMLVTAAGWGRRPSPELLAAWRPVAARLDAARGPVMNDDATTLLSLIGGRPLHMEGLGYSKAARWLERRHGYRFADVAARLRQGRYAILVNPEDLGPLAGMYRPTEMYEVPGEFGEPVRLQLWEPSR